MKKIIKEDEWVMLPTEGYPSILVSNTHIAAFGAKKEKIYGWEECAIRTGHTCNHLYLTSSEEIKEGDWFINHYKELILATKEVVKNLTTNHKKVIATTDKSLTIGILPNKIHRVINPETEKGYQLPQIPEEMVKYYVEKQGEVGDLEVEYNFATREKDSLDDDKILFCGGTRVIKYIDCLSEYDLSQHDVLTLTENNEIIVHLPEEAPFKDTLKIRGHITRFALSQNIPLNVVEKWIKENL